MRPTLGAMAGIAAAIIIAVVAGAYWVGENAHAIKAGIGTMVAVVFGAFFLAALIGAGVLAATRVWATIRARRTTEAEPVPTLVAHGHRKLYALTEEQLTALLNQASTVAELESTFKELEK